MTRLAFITLFALAALGRVALAAGSDGVASPEGSPAERAKVDFEEKVGAQVPLDVPFRDENDQPITLRQCVNGKPTVLVLAYYRCPLLCTEVLNGLTDALRAMPPDYTAGGKFNVVTVSFDPKEHASLASAKRQSYLQLYGRPEAEWRFLTGSKESIAELTQAVGFKYEYDRVYKEYNHPSGIIVLTPEGKAARYFLGLGYGSEYKVPGGTTTLRLSLVEASDGKMGSVLDRVTLLCYRFDDHTKGYSLYVKRMVQVGGIVTMMAIATGLFFAVRSERRKKILSPPLSKGGQGGLSAQPHASVATGNG